MYIHKKELLHHLSAVVGDLLIARCVVLNISKDVFQENSFFILCHTLPTVLFGGSLKGGKSGSKVCSLIYHKKRNKIYRI